VTISATLGRLPPEERAMSQTRTIALMFDLNYADHATRQVVLGIERYAERTGSWHCVLDPFALEHLPCGYHGLIGPGGVVLQDRATAAGVPYVFTTPAAHGRRVNRMAPGYYQAGLLAAGHLRAHGYRRFGYFGHGRDAASYQMERGFRAGLRERGQVATYCVVSRQHRWFPRVMRNVLGRAAEWLDELTPPVGILTSRDLFARHIAETARRRGLRVPEEVGIVAAGNDPTICLLPPVALTAIDFAYETVGYKAAALLDHLMGGGPPLAGNTLVEPTLIARASTDREYFEDQEVADAVRYIAEHCHRRLSVAEIGQAVSLGPRQLLRRFLRNRGRTVAAEITHARLARARGLLTTTELPHGIIDCAVGFGTAHRLRRVFLKHEGMLPSAYRGAEPHRRRGELLPLQHAKTLLERTDHSIDMVAGLCGFRSHIALSRAFVRQEGITASEYRARHRRQPRPPRPPQMEILLDGDEPANPEPPGPN
jgi:LacI family transcriptional regulator